MTLQYAGPRLGPRIIRLAPGETYLPDFPGWYHVNLGLYCNVQRLDPSANVWRYSGDGGILSVPVYFDGYTTRIANTTGCAVAALVSAAGSGYTSTPTVTASAGSSTWVAVVGGAISTATVISAAGAGYQFPPLVFIDAPPYPGVQASATATINNGTISGVIIDNQGAGYLFPPAAQLINDSRDSVGYGGQVTLALTGAQTITAVLCTNHGNPITSGTVPSLTFSGGGGSAATVTAIMDWTVNSVTISAAGAGYTSAAGAITAAGAGGYLTTTPVLLGTNTTLDMTRWRPASIAMTTNASGGMTAATIIDGGRYQLTPTPIITGAQAYTTVGTLAFAMGGANGSIFMSPASAQS